LFAREIYRKFKKPIIVHILDDYPATLGKDTLLPKFYNYLINKDLKLLLKISYKRFAISELMANEYNTRFGGNWDYFHNPINFEFWNKHRKIDYTANIPFIILYSGRLSDGIGECIKKVAECIDELNEQEFLNIQLKIQSRQNPEWIYKYKNIIYSNYIDYDLLPDLFSSSDLLLLPYDFNGYGYQYIRLSMPTKVSEYLASATPVLAISPDSTALVSYLKKHNIGYIVTDETNEVVKSSIRELYFNKNLREEIGKRGASFAKLHHEKKDVQKKFIASF